MRIHKKGACADKPKETVMDEVKDEINNEVKDAVMDELKDEVKDEVMNKVNYEVKDENKDEQKAVVEEKSTVEDSNIKTETNKTNTKSGVLDPEEDSKKNPWNYQELDLKSEDNLEADSDSRKDVNRKEPGFNSDKKDPSKDNPEKVESKEENKFPGVYRPAPVVDDESDDEYEDISDDSAPDDDDVEAVLGLMRKRTFKPKKKKLINKEMLSTKAVYLTLASGQRVKKYTFQKEQQKFTPSKPWIPYRSQVSVAQVCKYLEMKDVTILSTPALRHKCKDRTFFDSIARPLLRRANPDSHPLVLDTLVRAKWFEVMNVEDESKWEPREGGVKRKLSCMDTTGGDRVKRIKVNVRNIG